LVYPIDVFLNAARAGSERLLTSASIDCRAFGVDEDIFTPAAANKPSLPGQEGDGEIGNMDGQVSYVQADR
jgi:hypothetical protein